MCNFYTFRHFFVGFYLIGTFPTCRCLVLELALTKVFFELFFVAFVTLYFAKIIAIVLAFINLNLRGAFSSFGGSFFFVFGIFLKNCFMIWICGYLYTTLHHGSSYYLFILLNSTVLYYLKSIICC